MYTYIILLMRIIYALKEYNLCDVQHVYNTIVQIYNVTASTYIRHVWN